MQDTAQEINNNPIVGVGSDDGTGIRQALRNAAESATILFDAAAEQRFAFDADDATDKIVFVYAGLPDDVLAEFDRLREVLVEAEGDNTDINTNSVAADNYLFRELC